MLSCETVKTVIVCESCQYHCDFVTIQFLCFNNNQLKVTVPMCTDFVDLCLRHNQISFSYGRGTLPFSKPVFTVPSTLTLNGPQGHVSAKTVASVEMIEWGLQRLLVNVIEFGHKFIKLYDLGC